MEAVTGTRVPRKFTGEGQAARDRILEHAAELICAKGVHATNNQQLRRAAGVSGSQLNHYFPTEETLIALARRRVDVLFAMLRDGAFYQASAVTSA